MEGVTSSPVSISGCTPKHSSPRQTTGRGLSIPRTYGNPLPKPGFTTTHKDNQGGHHPVAITRWVEGGGETQWPATQIEVLDTPGFTRGSVSYLCEVDGRRIAFTGDLIYGDGQLLDLYSLQDAIPEAKVGGCPWLRLGCVDWQSGIHPPGRT